MAREPSTRSASRSTPKKSASALQNPSRSVTDQRWSTSKSAKPLRSAKRRNAEPRPSGLHSTCTVPTLQRALDHDRLRVGVVVQRLRPVLLAVARRLQTAERKLVVDLGRGVDPRVAAVELGRRALGGLEAARPQRGAEAERRVVGQLDRLVEVLDAPDRQRGAEDLLARHRRVLARLEHDGRLMEPAPLEALRAAAAGQDLA